MPGGYGEDYGENYGEATAEAPATPVGRIPGPYTVERLKRHRDQWVLPSKVVPNA